MNQPWHPEIVLTADQALELVVAQFPQFRGEQARLLGVGWDSTAFLVGDVVFRFPRRAVAVPLLETEASVLPRLAPALPLPVPLPLWRGRATRDYPWPFLGHRRLPGVAVSERPLAGTALHAAAATLGGFLRTLHALDPSAFALPPDPIQRLEMTPRLPILVERLDSLHRAGLIAQPRAWLDLFQPPLPPPTGHAVVHGDLYARHILADHTGTLCAIIDWGDVHAGDPAADLSILWTFPPDVRPDFLAAYGPVAPETARLARLRMIFHSAAVAVFAHAQHDETLLRGSLQALAHALQA